MRKASVVVTLLVVAALAPIASAQYFTGAFIDTAGGVSVSLQEMGGGYFSGMLMANGAQYWVEGQAAGYGAYGAIQNGQQGYWFEAQASADGQWLNLVYYSSDQYGQLVSVGGSQLQRQAGVGQYGASGWDTSAYDPSRFADQYGAGNLYTGYMDPMASMDAILANVQAQQAALDVQMQNTWAQIQAQQRQFEQYFIDLYRSTTGDMTTPDAQALLMGQSIHCQRYPDDCARAAQTAQQGAQSSLAARQASFDSWLAGVQSKDAAFDASVSSWMDGQRAADQQHSNYINGVILGVDQYAPTGGGQGVMLPYAPNQGDVYQGPNGLPMVFDNSSNTWYQVNPDGTYTPYYYQAP